MVSSSNTAHDYKIVSDSVNKVVTPCYLYFDRPSKSHNYVHSYAVKDQVDFSNLSQVPRHHPSLKGEETARSILPSFSDDLSLKQTCL